MNPSNANHTKKNEKNSIRTTLESVSKDNALKAMMCSYMWLMQDIRILARQLSIQIACAMKIQVLKFQMSFVTLI